MDREIDIIQYWPAILRDSKDYTALATAENPEFVSLQDSMADVLNDLFVLLATENGIKRWESILKITPKGTDTLDIRRFRILSRLCKQLPYTHRSLAQQLATLCGADGYSLVITYNSYLITVRVALTQKRQCEEVEKLLKKVVPANMTVDLSLLYNQHSTLKKYTHAQLGAFTHKQIRNEVMP